MKQEKTGSLSSGPLPKGVDRESERLLVCIALQIYTGAFFGLSALHPWGGWRSISILAVTLMLPLIVYIIVRRDMFCAALLAACVTAGFVETLADWYLISVDRSLVYVPGGPYVWQTPLYMPFGWTFALFSLGMIGRWMDRRWGLLTATIVSGLFGAMIIPFWEHCAKYGGWWYYENTPMIGSSPYYIILGECIIVASLPLALRYVDGTRWKSSLAVGIAIGLWILPAYWVGIQLFG
jgi:hypothetical protein